ncbi:MAG TPA: hypothetical protein VLM91_06075 [Candidatus Methylomirabilis sp.]|nr:hypothetical protein [Candidatus Methylomirabilis sp.]
MVTPLIQLLVVLILGWGNPAVGSDHPSQGTSADALKVARESLGRFSLGSLTVRERSHGRLRARAEILLDGTGVARLLVDPRTGTFLSEEERPQFSGEMLDGPTLRLAVERSLRQLEIGEWTWPTEHGRAWGVPLKYQGRVVGTLKIDRQKGVLPRESDED